MVITKNSPRKDKDSKNLYLKRKQDSQHSMCRLGKMSSGLLRSIIDKIRNVFGDNVTVSSCKATTHQTWNPATFIFMTSFCWWRQTLDKILDSDGSPSPSSWVCPLSSLSNLNKFHLSLLFFVILPQSSMATIK